MELGHWREFFDVKEGERQVLDVPEDCCRLRYDAVCFGRKVSQCVRNWLLSPPSGCMAYSYSVKVESPCFFAQYWRLFTKQHGVTFRSIAVLKRKIDGLYYSPHKANRWSFYRCTFVEIYTILLTASLLFSAFRFLVAILGIRAYDFVNLVFNYEILFDGNGIWWRLQFVYSIHAYYYFSLCCYVYIGL